jgi:hypothetical protein
LAKVVSFWLNLAFTFAPMAREMQGVEVVFVQHHAVRRDVVALGIFDMVKDYRARKLEWFERHAGLGGWVGAVGAIIAVFVAWGLARSEYERALQLEKDRMNADISLIDRTVSEFDLTVQKYIQLARANDPEVKGYYNKHLSDPERSRMNSLTAMPIIQWPSIESYDAFMRYLAQTGAVLLPVDANDLDSLEQRKQGDDNALGTLRAALKDARR